MHSFNWNHQMDSFIKQFLVCCIISTMIMACSSHNANTQITNQATLVSVSKYDYQLCCIHGQSQPRNTWQQDQVFRTSLFMAQYSLAHEIAISIECVIMPSRASSSPSTSHDLVLQCLTFEREVVQQSRHLPAILHPHPCFPRATIRITFS